MKRRSVVCGLVALAACGRAPFPEAAPVIAGLTAEIGRLNTTVDPAEAARIADISVNYSRQLAEEWRVVDSPLIHNTKVNLGLKPRGLCWQWADALQERLEAEAFETVSWHRAIANADNSFRIDHSTLIVSARGAGMYEGVVLDPWRMGGDLFWARVTADTDYKWVPRQDVFAERARRSVPE